MRNSCRFPPLRRDDCGSPGGRFRRATSIPTTALSGGAYRRTPRRTAGTPGMCPRSGAGWTLCLKTKCASGRRAWSIRRATKPHTRTRRAAYTPVCRGIPLKPAGSRLPYPRCGPQKEIIEEVNPLNWQSILDAVMKYWVQQLCTLIFCLITW